jgi:hypothetical protein
MVVTGAEGVNTIARVDIPINERPVYNSTTVTKTATVGNEESPPNLPSDSRGVGDLILAQKLPGEI